MKPAPAVREREPPAWPALSDEVEKLAAEVVDAALEVHKALGPGLLESVYETCLAHELKLRRISVARQVSVPVRYKGVRVHAALRMDLLVGGCLVVELKADRRELDLHRAQLLTYLQLTGLRLGLLVYFNRQVLRGGVIRVIR